ncbi:hypothetical protein F4776DRAFT_638223 [Hypoxylon sp. NC0597]|nr:hypothetical protein F4776DRAFT_638223 [Hypoxylon sp. NC0597]
MSSSVRRLCRLAALQSTSPLLLTHLYGNIKQVGQATIMVLFMVATLTYNLSFHDTSARADEWMVCECGTLWGANGDNFFINECGIGKRASSSYWVHRRL